MGLARCLSHIAALVRSAPPPTTAKDFAPGPDFGRIRATRGPGFDSKGARIRQGSPESWRHARRQVLGGTENAHDFGGSATLVAHHSGRDAESDPDKWEHGFLVPLRYHPDDIDEGNFLEVMECIQVLAEEIASSPTVDRELMAALWGLMYYPRWWAFNPMQLEGYIRAKSHTLDGKALSQLADQLDRIGEAVLYALEGSQSP